MQSLALPADIKFIRDLSGLKSLGEFLKNQEATSAISRWRKKFLEKADPLVPNENRDFFKIADDCRARLGVQQAVDFYLIQDNAFVSGVFPQGSDKFVVYLTSGLLGSFSDAELAFVIGRELGHILFHHTDIPTEIRLKEFSQMISPRELIALHSWLRMTEISADRAGLICAGDLAAAAQALYKISSGETSKNFNFNVREYMEDYDDLEKFIRVSPADRLDDLYSNHALNPIRLRALELFAQSQNDGRLPDVDMEQQISGFMNLLTPTYLEEQTNIAATVREFIFLVGYMLAKSDGEIAESELLQLSKLLDGQDANSRMQEAKALTHKRLTERICSHAEQMSSELPAVQRLNIVRDAFSIVSADGQVQDSELKIMNKVCGVLKIRPSFVDELLKAAS